MTRTVLALVALLAGSIGTPEATRPLVLSGGTIVDVSGFGSSTGDLADAVVVIEDDRIVAAGRRGRVRVPDGARVIDVAGTFIVPGLNDVFATVNNQAQANAFLYMGVTGVVGIDDPGGRRGPLFLGASPGPHIYPLEELTGYDAASLPPGRRTVGDLLKDGRRLTDAELRREIDRLAASGVKVLLLYYTLGPDQVRSAAAYARGRGLATIGELGATTYPEAIDAGVMAFVHTSRYSLELAPPPLRAEVARAPFGPPRRRFYEHLASIRKDDAALEAYAKRLAGGRSALIPTLAMNDLELPGHANPWTKPVAAILDPKDIHLPADRQTGEPEKPADAVRDAFPPGATESLMRIEAQYCRAGATYLAGSGTDAFGTMPGLSLHTELERLVGLGLTPRRALAAATGNVGAVFGWSCVGQVKAGCDADLLVLEANPVTSIANLDRIRYVVRGGRLFERAALLTRSKVYDGRDEPD